MKEFWQRIITFLKGDPKPVFDHIRNIGISVSLIVAAAFIQSNYYTSNESGTYKYLILFLISNLSAIGVATFILNVDHAQRGISALLFGPEYDVNIFTLIRNAQLTYYLRKSITSKDVITEVIGYSLKQLALQFLILLYLVSVLIIAFSFLIAAPKLEPKKRNDYEVLKRLDSLNDKFDLLLQKQRQGVKSQLYTNDLKR